MAGPEDKEKERRRIAIAAKARARVQQAPVAVPETPTPPTVAPSPMPPEASIADRPREGKPFFEWYLGPDYAPLKQAKSGGTVYKNAKTGELPYYSPTFETFDKKAVEKLTLGASEDFVQKERGRKEIGKAAFQAAPLRTAASQFAAGGFGFGEFIDNFYEVVAPSLRGKEQTQKDVETMRAARQAFEEEMPLQAAGFKVAGTLATLPASVAKAGVGRGLGTIQRMVSGALRTGTIGAAEEALSEAGRADEGTAQDRFEAGQRGAVIGGTIGAFTGLVTEPAAIVVKNLRQTFTRSKPREIAKGLGVSEEAASEIAEAMRRSDFAAARQILDDAGETAMLADAGIVLRSMLDNAIIEGTEVAASVSQSAVRPRIVKIQKQLSSVLNTVLGRPLTVDEILEGIQAPQRQKIKDLYDKAYLTEIDDTTLEGSRILDRVKLQLSQSDIDQANEFLRISAKDPQNITQIVRKKDKQGNITLSLSNGGKLTVREIDRITRQMQDRAIKMHKDINPLAFGVSKLKSGDGTDLEILAQSLRADARTISKDYDEALKASKDVIEERQAAMLGTELLKKETTLADVAEALTNATPAERTAMRLGLSNEVDSLIKNTRVTLASPDPDINALRDLWSKFNSPDAKNKVRLLLGNDDYDKIYGVLGEAEIAFNLQGAIAKNSATAARQAVERISAQRNAPGIRDLLMEIRFPAAGQRLLQTFTGRRPEDMLRRSQMRWDDMATILTTVQGKDAKDALALIEKVVNRQKLTEKQAQELADALRKHVVPMASAAEETPVADEMRQSIQEFRYNPETDDFE